MILEVRIRCLLPADGVHGTTPAEAVRSIAGSYPSATAMILDLVEGNDPSLVATVNGERIGLEGYETVCTLCLGPLDLFSENFARCAACGEVERVS